MIDTPHVARSEAHPSQWQTEFNRPLTSRA